MKIAIIGGGPAGSFCAIQILKLSKNCQHEVTIYDSKPFSRFGPPGCNLGAGVIARSIIETFKRHKIAIPPNVIQNVIKGFSFYTEGGERHLKIPDEKTFYSVFRGGGPRDVQHGESMSFDEAILEHAKSLGVDHAEVKFTDIDFPKTPGSPFALRDVNGKTYNADVVVGAFGVNSVFGKRIETKGFGYRSPRSINVCQAEMPVDDNFIAKSYGSNIKVLSLKIPGVRFVALTPKKGYITVTVIANKTSKQTLDRVLMDKRLLKHFPDGFVPPDDFCNCQPNLPVSPAKNPYSDGFVMIGDAHVSRYYKNGIGSAFRTATFAAENISAGKVSKNDFRNHYYRKCVETYYRDNMYGKGMFLLNDFISKSRFLSSVHLSLAEKGSVSSPEGRNIMDEILINLFTGESPYREIIFKTPFPKLQYEILKEILTKIWER